jgi:hypothetical protein
VEREGNPEVKTFTNQAAQGDVLLIKIDHLPEGLQEVPPEFDGTRIIAHSETMHHHIVEAEKTTLYRLPESIYECFLVVKEQTELRHLRSFHTHESILLQPGIFRVRRQRERAYTPEGWRRVQD